MLEGGEVDAEDDGDVPPHCRPRVKKRGLRIWADQGGGLVFSFKVQQPVFDGSEMLVLYCTHVHATDVDEPEEEDEERRVAL